MKHEPNDEYDVELDEALQSAKTGVPPVLGRYVPGTDDPMMTYSDDVVQPAAKEDDEFDWDSGTSEADLDW